MPTTKRTSKPQTPEAIMEKWLAKQDRAVEKAYRVLCSKRTPPEEKEISTADFLEAVRSRQRSQLDAMLVRCFDLARHSGTASRRLDLAQIITEVKSQIESIGR